MKLFNKCLALVMACTLFSPAIVKATEANVALRVYVSKDGDDNNTGSEKSPFQTLDGAKKYLRSLNRSGMKKGRIEVILKEGEYFFEETFQLEKEDSGTEENPVIYMGEPGKTVKITNSKSVSNKNFELIEDEETLSRLPEGGKENVYRVDLKKLGITDYGEVERKEYGKAVKKQFEIYFNGNTLTLSRYPNDKYMLTGQVESTSGEGVTFKYEGDRYKKWATADQALVYGFWENGYGDDGMFVTEINQERGTISTASKPSFGIRSDRKYYIYNLLEEVDNPGEYFLDRNTGILYIYPPSDMSGAKIELCTNSNLFVNVANAQYISFENLLFEGTCGNAMATQYSKFIEIRNCRIMNIAGTAVTFTGGSDCSVYGCELYNLGGSGVVSYSGDRKTLTPGNITVENCHIHKFAQYSKTYTPAVNLYFVGNKVLNNVIHDCPHMAIGINGNNNIIMYNEIYDVCQETDDCGAMYGGRDWTTYGNVISNNYIHDVRGPGSQSVGVYLDDMMSGIRVENNIFDSVTLSIAVGGGHNNTVRNNLIMNKTKFTKSALYYDDRGLQEWFAGSYKSNPSGHQLTTNLNAVPYKSDIWAEAYPELAPSVETDPLVAKNPAVINNIVSNNAGFDIADSIAEAGVIENNYSTENKITIIRNAKGKYSFEDSYGVFDEVEGFEKIDIEKIGLNDDWQFEYPEKFEYVEKQVEYEKIPAPETDVKPLLNDASKWDQSSAKVTVVEDELEITEGTTGYMTEKFTSSKMKYRFAMNENTNWVGFMLHSSITNEAPWVEGKSYLIVVKKDSFELQRWVSGGQLMIRTYENVLYPGDNEYTNIEFEISNLKDDVGVNVIMRYNGIEVFNYVDTEENAIVTPGYFSVYNTGKDSLVRLGEYDESLQREVAANPYGEGIESEEKKVIKIKCDGKFITFKDEPEIIDNLTYINGEDFFKNRGFDVKYNAVNSTLIAVAKELKVVLKADGDIVAVGNNIVQLRGNVFLKDGMLRIPVGDIAEILGYDVSWDGTTNTVSLKTK